MSESAPGIGSGPVIRRKQDGSLDYQSDELTVEEPLEIRVGRKTLATTMRTPGHDEELAAGFLLSEGIVRTPGQLANISRLENSPNRENVIVVELAPGVKVKLSSTQRYGTISSSCGICGKTASPRFNRIFLLLRQRQTFASRPRYWFRFRRFCKNIRATLRAPGGFTPPGFSI